MQKDYAKDRKIDIRNANCVFHDVVKLLTVINLIEKHPESPIYTEERVPESNDITDVQIHLKNKILNIEIQKILTKEWYDKIMNRDNLTETDTLIIPLQKLDDKFEKMILELKEEIKRYLI
jgi:hypothetical protein